jgi:aminoglycoside phosphotransferase family enzyme/predicted kinase
MGKTASGFTVFSRLALLLRSPNKGGIVRASDAKNRNSQSVDQQGLVSAMMRPGFYPKPPSKVTHKQTHISHVFLAGDLVYKVKKAVRYSFLDYSTLSKRRHFLQEELRLNRRLAPSVYLGVLPITFDGMAWRLGGWGPPAEYSLVMRRLPERRMLPFLLDSGQVSPEMMRALAEVLARFHADADRAMAMETSRHLETVEKQWNENLADLLPFVDRFIDADTLKTFKDFGRDVISRHRELLRRRAAQGWIRDVHGDLHCEHICFAPEGIQIYDCIEFSTELRQCDLASEIAFLLMDLEVRGRLDLAMPFLARYLELIDDGEMPLLLPFYQCYRALVRGKVEAMSAESGDDHVSRYFRHARRLTWEPLKPFLVVVCGLTGSGKSTLARELGERLAMQVISSDSVRKAMAGKRGKNIVPFGTGIYSEAMTEKTYASMAREAEKQILAGNGAILDATFIRRAHREEVLCLAAKSSVPFGVIHCFACDETTKKRLAQRAEEGKDISDGRWEIYKKQKAAYQPMEEMPAGSCLELDTGTSVEQLACASENFLRSRLI